MRDSALDHINARLTREERAGRRPALPVMFDESGEPVGLQLASTAGTPAPAE